VEIPVEVFWVVTPCTAVVGYRRFGGSYCLHLEDENGGTMTLRNVGILPRQYTAPQPRRPRLGSYLCHSPSILWVFCK